MKNTLSSEPFFRYDDHDFPRRKRGLHR